jgi:flagellar assembly factor FliW
MKLATENAATLQQCQLHFPFGLIGLADLQKFELIHIEGSWPFMSMRSIGGEGEVSFVVMEPQGVIPDYELELTDEDADSLRIQQASDALVLNIVTIHSAAPLFVTVNLAGPLILNKTTLVGRQLVIGRRDSVRHVLIDQRKQEGSAQC